MIKQLFFVFIFLSSMSAGLSQPARTSKPGLVVYNKPAFKHFAILLRDTSADDNKFDSRSGIQLKRNQYTGHGKYVVYQPLLVDSLLFFTCENRLLNPDSNVTFYSYPNNPRGSGSVPNRLRKYIRLYIGYIVSSERKDVFVQFVTKREFRRQKYIYSKSIFLIVGQKHLRFATIHSAN